MIKLIQFIDLLSTWVGKCTGWLILVLTFGELFILPTGLGLFARLAPPHLGATTVASWFLVIFSGSLSAGLVGMLWSSFSPAAYFLLLAAIAGLAAILLRAIGAVADRGTAS